MYLAGLFPQSLNSANDWSRVITIHCMRFHLTTGQQRAHYLHPVYRTFDPSQLVTALSSTVKSIFHTHLWKSFTAALENREILLAEKVKWSQAYKDLLEPQWEEWWYICAPSNVWLRVYLAVASPVCHEHGGYLCGNGEQNRTKTSGWTGAVEENGPLWCSKKPGEHTFLPFGFPVAWISW